MATYSRFTKRNKFNINKTLGGQGAHPSPVMGNLNPTPKHIKLVLDHLLKKLKNSGQSE